MKPLKEVRDSYVSCMIAVDSDPRFGSVSSLQGLSSSSQDLFNRPPMYPHSKKFIAIISIGYMICPHFIQTNRSSRLCIKANILMKRYLSNSKDEKSYSFSNFLLDSFLLQSSTYVQHTCTKSIHSMIVFLAPISQLLGYRV